MDTSKQEISVAVFDVDGTLIKDNIGLTFVKFLLERGVINLPYKLRIIFVYVLYKARLLDFSYAIKCGGWALSGISTDIVKSEAKACFEEKIKPFIFEDAMVEISKLKEKHYNIVLATGAHASIAQELSDFLDADECVSARSTIQNGVYGSKMCMPLPYREGKRELVSEVVQSKYQSSYIIVYSDESKDIPMLGLGDEVVAVNADQETTDYVLDQGGRLVEFR